MKKQFYCLFLTALLTACGSAPPNLLHTKQPILNIDANLAPLIETRVSTETAWVKNKTRQPIRLAYGLYWYDENGVTQVEPPSFTPLLLKQNEKYRFNLVRPTQHSQNYRLYLRLN